MTLLSRAWPDYLGARASEARKLSQILGDDHDLAMLVVFVHSDAAAGLGNEQAAIVEKAARQRQAELRESGEAARRAPIRRRSPHIAAQYRRLLAVGRGAQGARGGRGDAVPAVKHIRRQSAPRRRAAAAPKA